MDIVDIIANLVMFIATIALIAFGISKGLSLTELTINLVYFTTLIFYLVKINFFAEQ